MEGIVRSNKRPHAVCVPLPSQGHMNPMLMLAKLLHHKGFHVTFVNTEFNHNRILRSQGPDSLKGLPSFQFMSIPPDADSPEEGRKLVYSVMKNSFAPLRDLILKLNSDTTNNPPVTCIVSDILMGVTLDVAQHFGIPNAVFYVINASNFTAYSRYSRLTPNEILPLKDVDLDSSVTDWMPELEGMPFKNLPSFINLIEGDNFVNFKFLWELYQKARSASAIILNSFDGLEDERVMDALSSILPPIYNIGPAHQLVHEIPNNYNTLMSSNLLKEDMECLEMLDSKEPNSVIYVCFGSLIEMTSEQLVELAWGIANSNKNFLWAIRPGFVEGEDAKLPPEFVKETKERGLMTSWCPQEQVLRHPSIAGFITHCGWNSMLEGICAGVPMICCPFSADQPTNAWLCRNRWGMGMEIDGDISRDKIEKLVRELMDTEKGKEMKRKAMELKKKVEQVVGPKGSSQLNLDKLIEDHLLH